MSDLDRAHLVDLLERLGAEDDGAALSAARQAHRIVSESDFDWDELILSEEDVEEVEEEHDREDDEEEEEEEEAGEPDAVAESEPVDLEEDARIIERLLAASKVSEVTRKELADLKQDMANGEFDAMDSRYVRALATRLQL